MIDQEVIPSHNPEEEYSIGNQQENQRTDFLEISVIAEIIQLIEQIDNKCQGQIGEDIVNERIKQVSYSKILCNVYGKDVTYLIKAYAQLGIAYLDITYYEQAQEHLLKAFKLNENLSDESNLNMKEYQIKILVNLSKCYLENDKENAALQICERSLKMNQTLFGEEHISNADIYYVLAKINTKMKNYETAIENLRKMYNIFEKIYGLESEKIAKLCMEIGQVYDMWNLENDSVEYYRKSYEIWEKIINDDNYEVLFQIAMKLSDLLTKLQKDEEAYHILCETDEKYGEKTTIQPRDRFKYQQTRIQKCKSKNDLNLVLDEYLRLEKFLDEQMENQKTLAKTCVSIGYIYLELGEKQKCLDYLSKAEHIFKVNGDKKYEDDIQQRKIDIQKQPEQSQHDESEFAD